MAKKPRGNLSVAVNNDKTPGPGHNASTEDVQRGLHFKSHVPDYERALQAKKDADAHFKNVCKRIKSEGGDIDDIKLTIRLRTPEGEKEFKALLERQRRVAEWNNLPIGQQGWLLDNDPRSLEEKAFADGEYAGLNNGDAKPPYDPGSVGHEAWMKGWHKSQAVLAGGFKKTTTAPIVSKNEENKDPSKTDEFDQGGEGQEKWPDDAQVENNKK